MGWLTDPKLTQEVRRGQIKKKRNIETHVTLAGLGGNNVLSAISHKSQLGCCAFHSGLLCAGDFSYLADVTHVQVKDIWLDIWTRVDADLGAEVRAQVKDTPAGHPSKVGATKA